jgi:hypothetical protein
MLEFFEIRLPLSAFPDVKFFFRGGSRNITVFEVSDENDYAEKTKAGCGFVFWRVSKTENAGHFEIYLPLSAF